MTFMDYIGLTIALCIVGFCIMLAVEMGKQKKQVAENIAANDEFTNTLEQLNRVDVKIDDSATRHLNN